MIFRKKSAEPGIVEEVILDEGTGEAESAEAAPDEGGNADRSRGPWDVSEIDDVDSRIDVGSLLIAGVPGLSMQVQVDEQTQRITMVTLVLEDAAVQIQAFAAPRSAGIWDDVRKQLSASITASGGLVESAEGRFGTELRARVPGPDKSLQPARFVGIDGPRWFLRGLFLGSAAGPDGHEGLTGVFADIAVVRGEEAMPSGEPLPLRLPPQDDAAGTPASGDEAGDETVQGSD